MDIGMLAPDDAFVRCVVISLALVLGACATVTRTENLETEPARAWLRETADARISIDSPGDVTATGRIVAATAGAVHLQAADGHAIDIPVRDGTWLRERKRAGAAVLGAFAGMVIGVVTGLVLDEALAVPNQDSAGGREHPPLIVPLGLLAGTLVGSIVGVTIGTERRLEVAAPGRARGDGP